MNERRAGAGCTVFEGRIVVAGGINDNLADLNTVESYDTVADEWSPKVNMINKVCNLSLVAFKNKLFTIAVDGPRNVCEVFDRSIGKFVNLKIPENRLSFFNQSMVIGNKITVFISGTESGLINCYDIDEDEWTEESCEPTKYLCCFACVKLPCYEFVNI